MRYWARVGPAVPLEAPTGAGTASVPSSSSSSLPSSPGPLKVALEIHGKVSTTLENELDFLGPSPYFLYNAAHSIFGPLSELALS
ncbi:hypothetical protein O181_035266 [Austropuccinia psidii MF-1]|uniref:Uncharacterized protein n=1 Tax=Austropuccinia psidii MF-1 TaxID=1389203 RepID=A0A9Q3H8T4_9BASI|nr:hypothetical protein [Austropuccinia psidii MF-1]